jgi:hypothetical protein
MNTFEVKMSGYVEPNIAGKASGSNQPAAQT